jgi:hypothetical protein
MKLIGQEGGMGVADPDIIFIDIPILQKERLVIQFTCFILVFYGCYSFSF